MINLKVIAMYVYVKQNIPYIILLIVSLACRAAIWFGLKYI